MALPGFPRATFLAEHRTALVRFLETHTTKALASACGLSKGRAKLSPFDP